MSKAKFAEAKALIDAKRYAEARSLLKTIDHPTAREWEAKLDKLDLPPAKPKSNGRRAAIIAGVVVILIMVVYMAGGGAEGLANRRSTQTAAAVVAIITQDAAATSIALTPPTATNAPADTVTPSATATITDTPAPSATATATSTPSAETLARTVLEGVIGVGDVERLSLIEVGEPKLLAMDYPMPEDFSGYRPDFAGGQMLKMACALYAAGFTGYRYQFSAMINLVNRVNGNTSRDDGLSIRVSSDVVSGWNCENVDQIDPALAVEEYILNPVFDE